GGAGMLATTKKKDEAALLQVSQDMGAILVQGIRAASVVPTFFSQVAATMLGVAASQFSAQAYELPLRSGFVRHGVLPPAMALAAARARMPRRTEAVAATRTESQKMPTPHLSIAENGIGNPSILLYAAAKPNHLQTKAPAPGLDAAPSPGKEKAPKSFFEDLLRRGRLKVPGKPGAEIVRASAASTHETHTHELRREGGQMVLRRVRIDCGHACC